MVEEINKIGEEENTFEEKLEQLVNISNDIARVNVDVAISILESIKFRLLSTMLNAPVDSEETEEEDTEDEVEEELDDEDLEKLNKETNEKIAEADKLIEKSKEDEGDVNWDN